MAEEDVNGVKEEKVPALNDQIVRQIEYYFGDINLPRDKFLQEQVKLEDGWVPLDVMLKFKRLSSMTTDTDAIVSALAASELMEVSEDKKKIRRNPDQPLPIFNEERRKELMTRSIYCKGFPVEGTTLDKLLDFFKSHGPVDNIQMRSFRDKATNTYTFKGSVFVIFKTRERAEEFLGKDIKYEDIELIKKWQVDYIEDKRKERLEKKNTKKHSGHNNEKKKEEKEEKKDEPLPLGAILHLKGFNGETTRDDLKDKLIKEGLDVAFIDFNKGDSEAWIRLLGENSSKNFVEKLEDNKLEVCGSELEARTLEGEEEQKFLEKTKQDIEKRRELNSKSRKGRRGGRGGRHHGHHGKRKGSPVRGEPASKKVKEPE